MLATALNTEAVEKLYFNMFPIAKEPYFKRLLLFVTYETIKTNNKITLNKLCWHLNVSYEFTKEDISIAIAALYNSNLFGSINKHAPNRSRKEGVLHLSVKTDCTETIDSWLNDVKTLHPEFNQISAKTVI